MYSYLKIVHIVSQRYVLHRAIALFTALINVITENLDAKHFGVYVVPYSA